MYSQFSLLGQRNELFTHLLLDLIALAVSCKFGSIFKCSDKRGVMNLEPVQQQQQQQKTQKTQRASVTPADQRKKRMHVKIHQDM